MTRRGLLLAVITVALLGSLRAGAQEDPERLGLPVTVLLSCDDGSTITRQLTLGEREVRLEDLPAGTICTVRELDTAPPCRRGRSQRPGPRSRPRRGRDEG